MKLQDTQYDGTKEDGISEVASPMKAGENSLQYRLRETDDRRNVLSMSRSARSGWTGLRTHDEPLGQGAFARPAVLPPFDHLQEHDAGEHAITPQPGGWLRSGIRGSWCDAGIVGVLSLRLAGSIGTEYGEYAAIGEWIGGEVSERRGEKRSKRSGKEAQTG